MSDFPTDVLVPKADSQVEAFQERFPKYDGKDVVIAILDTGCDCNADGLLTCPDGSKKFLDFIDTTGSGDVDTSTQVECITGTDAEASRVLVSPLSGRRFILNKEWKNPSGKWHVGVRDTYSLFPKPLVRRLKEENKAKVDALKSQLVSEIEHDVSVAENSKKTEEVDELKAKLSVLKEASITDAGDLFDVITWHDGEEWCCIVNYKTDAEIDVSKDTPTYAYKHKQQILKYTEESNLYYTVNFYEDGAITSLVVAAGTHGTHVAGITAAYFPEDPSRNGNAPNAKLISIKIGDTHLGSMETTTGLLRALKACVDWKVDLMNMSYGEASIFPNRGRFDALANEIVEKHGIIYVTSAGNSGPCLSTTGAIPENLISCGAYITPSMISQYGFLTDLTNRVNYQWSSRGPAMDGGASVTLSALGSAVTSVNTWQLARSQQMNGTSMASPAACGAIAALLSGLKQQGIKYTPGMIKNALQATCSKSLDCAHEKTDGKGKVFDPLALGAGFLCINDAYDLLCDAEARRTLLQYSVRCSTADTCARTTRGVYIYQPDGNTRDYCYNITVSPKFPKYQFEVDQANPHLVPKGVKPCDPLPHLRTYTIEEQTQWETPVVFEYDNEYITCPKDVFLPSQGKMIQIKVHATKVPENTVIHREIIGKDAATKIPIIRIPVTIIAPSTKSSITVSEFQPNIAKSWFLAVPAHAVKAKVTLTLEDTALENAFTLTMYSQMLCDQLTHDGTSNARMVQLTKHTPFEFVCDVQQNNMLQLCLVKPWNQVGDGVVKMDIEFTGVSINGHTYTPTVFSSKDKYQPVLFSTCSPRMDITKPCVEFTHYSTCVHVSKVYCHVLGERDMKPDHTKSYRLTLEYKLDIKQKGSYTPQLNTTYGLLYESYLDSQRIMVFNANNKMVGYAEAFEQSMSLEPGKYVARVEFKHTDTKVLDALKLSTLHVKGSLESKVTANIASTIGHANSDIDVTLHKGEVLRGFIELPQEVKNVGKNDILYGTLKLKDASAEKIGKLAVHCVYNPSDKVDVSTTNLDIATQLSATQAPVKETTVTAEEAIEKSQYEYIKSVTPIQAYSVYTNFAKTMLYDKLLTKPAMEDTTIEYATIYFELLLKTVENDGFIYGIEHNTITTEEKMERFEEILQVGDAFLAHILNETDIIVYFARDVYEEDKKKHKCMQAAQKLLQLVYKSRALISNTEDLCQNDTNTTNTNATTNSTSSSSASAPSKRSFAWNQKANIGVLDANLSKVLLLAKYISEKKYAKALETKTKLDLPYSNAVKLVLSHIVDACQITKYPQFNAYTCLELHLWKQVYGEKIFNLKLKEYCLSHYSFIEPFM